MSRNNNSTNIHNAAQRTAAPQYGEPPRKLVLIVEDELPIAEALGFIIEDMGHAVCIVGEGRAALAAIRQHHPDLVFTDLMMPVMTGPDRSQRNSTGAGYFQGLHTFRQSLVYHKVGPLLQNGVLLMLLPCYAILYIRG